MVFFADEVFIGDITQRVILGEVISSKLGWLEMKHKLETKRGFKNHRLLLHLVLVPTLIFITFFFNSIAIGDEVKDDLNPYSKEALAKKNPTPAPTFLEEFTDKTSTLLDGMGDLGGSKLSSMHEEYNTLDFSYEYMLHNAYFVDIQDGDSERKDSVQTKLRNSASNTVAENATERFEMLKRIKDGLNFDLDLGRPFGGNSRKSRKSADVRYGLILKDVIVEKNVRFYSAATGRITENEMNSAQKADVVWGVGPISEDERKKIAILDNVEGVEKQKEFSLLSGNYVPSPVLKGGLKLNSFNDDVVSSGGFPGIEFSVHQEQNLYNFSVKTNDKFSKDEVKHTFSLPFKGSMALERSYNEKMEAVRTSAVGLLVDVNAPELSFHYMNMEEQLRSEASVEDDDQRISLIATSKAKKNPRELKEGELQEKYEISYTYDF